MSTRAKWCLCGSRTTSFLAKEMCRRVDEAIALSVTIRKICEKNISRLTTGKQMIEIEWGKMAVEKNRRRDDAYRLGSCFINSYWLRWKWSASISTASSVPHAMISHEEICESVGCTPCAKDTINIYNVSEDWRSEDAHTGSSRNHNNNYTHRVHKKW